MDGDPETEGGGGRDEEREIGERHEMETLIRMKKERERG